MGGVDWLSIKVPIITSKLNLKHCSTRPIHGSNITDYLVEYISSTETKSLKRVTEH